MTRWWLPLGRKGRFLAAAWLVALGFELLTDASAVRAQRFYRWTDERGVVHFSDSPPPDGSGNVEVRDLPVEPAAPPSEEATPEAAPEGGTPAEGTPAAKLSGDAQIKVVDQNQNRDGDSSYEFSGKVKNAGGKTAENVVVILTVTEPNQGAQCVHEEVEVDPPNLKPGQEGEYSIHLQNPCFFGPINTEIRPEWR